MFSAILAVFLLHTSCCFCFLVVHQDQGRRRSRFGGVLSSSSSVSDDLSTEGTTLDNHEAIQLKDDLVALAAATRRGVSRRYHAYYNSTYMKISYSHYIIFNSCINSYQS